MDSAPVDPSFGLLPDQKHLWFLSERDGWMHLYSLDATAPQPAARQLTQGKWEIDDVALSADKKKFYITSTEAHPGERHLYAMPIEGGDRTKLTSMTGGTSGEASPDDRTFGLIYSSSTKPNEVYVMPNRAGAAATQVTTSTSEEWRSYKWVEPQLVTYRTRDGVDVYARLFTPEMVGAKRDPAAPAVVFVHGAGYLQNAHKYWSTYYREYMFHNLLASRGYVVLDPDYRASAGYGRDWRTAIYRHMGGKDLDDVVDGAKFLVDKQKVNAKRIGVYGGSYGGFITLMAMFTTPDVFAAGAALQAGHRLDALQPRLHRQHPQRAAGRCRGVPEELADLLCGRAQGRAADLPRDGRHQRALPGQRPAGAAAHRAAQGELVDRALPGGEPRLRGGRELGGRVQAHPETVRGQPETP